MATTIGFSNGVQVRYWALGHYETAAGAVAVGLPSIPNEDRVTRVVIRPLSGDIYWTDDGTAPATSHGLVLYKDEILVYDGADLSKFKMISDTAADVRVAYYGV